MGRPVAISFSSLLWLLWLAFGISAASSESERFSKLPELRGRRTSAPAAPPAPGAPAWLVEGGCSVEGACVSSTGHPGLYASAESCTLAPQQRPAVVSIVAFSTEARYDTLVIDGNTFSGSGEGIVGTSVTVWSNISWTSDDSVESTGWQLCMDELPACDDGLPLRPVPISQCPDVVELLASCGEAQPGELCEADGACGTRTDINNCYDAHYSYPASRDVYQKSPGTSRTVTTSSSSMTSVTSTTQTSTPSVFSGQPSWTVQGDCKLVGSGGSCAQSSNYPFQYGPDERCMILAPFPSVVTVAAFSTENGYDQLTVNGESYSGDSLEGKSFVAWTNISWHSDGSASGSGWELCLEPLPSCVDGLLLTPVAVRDCPDPADVLPDCVAAAPGELCEGNGACGTRVDINNCYDSLYSHPPSRDVYRKSEGTTRTVTTTATTVTAQTTFTATRPLGGSYSGPIPWVVDGECGTFGACAESPNFPQAYGNGQTCTLSLPQPTVVKVMHFSTEGVFDQLQVNGHMYSGQSNSIVGESFVVWSNITWASDASMVDQGWQLCLEPPPYCSDGLGLFPVSVSECPLPSDVLPSCEVAWPGELCEGHGYCGTRTDINNCYDSSYTYPASRDVYRKMSGSTSTTSTASTTTETTQTSTGTETTTEIPGFWDGPAPWTVEGPCRLHGACVESPNFPQPYSKDEACALKLPQPSVVRITAFSTGDGDLLTINGKAYDGDEDLFTVWSNITWSSSGSGKGWQVCFEPLPSCVDGLPLTPVTVPDCPADSGSLPGCASAEAGEPCVGGGSCGTRDDINNCYDAAFTYPPSLDVYRKGAGTTKTSTTETSMTRTTSVTLTTTRWHEEGPWQFVGPCTIRGDCARTAESGECTLTLPKGTPVQVSRRGRSPPADEVFSINGVELAEGGTFVVDTEISWKSASDPWTHWTRRGTWEVCIETPLCSDGLVVSPVPSTACPTSVVDLSGCQAALPGELCVGDGECLTYTGLNNCPPAAVYRKEMGTTRTATTTISGTVTFTPSVWQVTGPCTVSGTCAQSPNYPEPYGPDERCELSLPPGTVVTVVEFATEPNYDRLTINGQDYSGPGRAIVGKSFTVESLSWRTDESQSAAGWRLCLAGADKARGDEGPVGPLRLI